MKPLLCASSLGSHYKDTNTWYDPWLWGACYLTLETVNTHTDTHTNQTWYSHEVVNTWSVSKLCGYCYMCAPVVCREWKIDPWPSLVSLLHFSVLSPPFVDHCFRSSLLTLILYNLLTLSWRPYFMFHQRHRSNYKRLLASLSCNTYSFFWGGSYTLFFPVSRHKVPCF